MHEDKRIFQRIPANLPLKFSVVDSKKRGTAQMLDISASGIGISTEDNLLRYTPLEMRLQMPDKAESFDIKGEVVWSKRIEPDRYDVGVSLEKVDLVDMLELWRVLKAA